MHNKINYRDKNKGILKLEMLLKNMSPKISKSEYVFCSVQALDFEILNKLDPICVFKEEEGITLVLKKTCAENENLHFDEVFNKITLQVHSSLEAVGLTAAVSTALANKGISANVIAAYYHDHIFVPKNKSDFALKVLQTLSLDS